MLFLVEADALTALRFSDGSIAWRLPFAEPLIVAPGVRTTAGCS